MACEKWNLAWLVHVGAEQLTNSNADDGNANSFFHLRCAANTVAVVTPPMWIAAKPFHNHRLPFFTGMVVALNCCVAVRFTFANVTTMLIVALLCDHQAQHGPRHDMI